MKARSEAGQQLPVRTGGFTGCGASELGYLSLCYSRFQILVFHVQSPENRLKHLRLRPGHCPRCSGLHKERKERMENIKGG